MNADLGLGFRRCAFLCGFTFVISTVIWSNAVSNGISRLPPETSFKLTPQQLYAG